jgi:hypothetical protein
MSSSDEILARFRARALNFLDLPEGQGAFYEPEYHNGEDLERAMTCAIFAWMVTMLR